MDFAGLSDKRDIRSGAEHRSNGARDRRARKPRVSTVHFESVHVSQGNSTSAPAMDRSAVDVDFSAAMSETADHRQADYFLRLLTQNRRLIDRRIDEYQKAIATSEANGDVEGTCGFRRTAHLEEQDRQTLDGLIENLHRRFPRRAPGKIPPILSRARLVVQ